MEKKLNSIIENCLLSALNRTERKNLITYFFERFQKNEGIKHVSLLDETVFIRMYDRLPVKSELTKIRYWRCGYHLPANRQEVVRLGHALNLTNREISQILTNVMLDTKLTTEKIPDTQTELESSSLKEQLLSIPDSTPPPQGSWHFKKWILLSSAYRYLVSLPSEYMDRLQILPGRQFEHLRHILYTDILDCLYHTDNENNPQPPGHSESLDFSSEVNRYFKYGEKISRLTLIRLFLIFTMPDTDVVFLNYILESFGFAPLSADIYTPSGVSQDRFILEFLEYFDTLRTANLPEDRKLFKSLLCLCDRSLVTRINYIPPSPKGSALYYKRLQLKDLRIMALHSLRKELI